MSQQRQRTSLKIIVLLLIIVLSACELKNATSKEVFKKIESNEEESFSKFESLFFTDESFQLSRIKFPLRGTSTDYVFDETTASATQNDTFSIQNGKFFWNKAGWIKLNRFDNSSKDFKMEQIVSENRVTQIIKGTDSDFTITIEFAKIKGKYFLVYYSSEWN